MALTPSDGPIACPACGARSPADKRFCGDCGAALARSEAGPAAAAVRGASEAERRQLTVMFADLVGSTELAERLDPEDMREVILAYQGACAQAVRRFGGYVARYLGDGILAYFGYPQAHEEDAERAVRSGLQLVEDVARLRPRGDLSLAARVGIATGLVVVGDLVGEGSAREEQVVGETPNLAARLQALAEPGAVVVAASTHHLVAHQFEYADLGERRFKGFAHPLRAWRVLAPSALGGARFDARRAAGLTPLVGREREVGYLLERWTTASQGRGQVVLLPGEPGIGKSRIVQALLEHVGGRPHTRLHYQCSPFHSNSALYPVLEQITRSAGLQRDDPPGVKLDKLEALLGLAAHDLVRHTPLIAALLSIPSDDRYAPLGLGPEEQKQRTLEVLRVWLAGLAARQPVLAVFEDAHWSDPTTQEVVGRFIEPLGALPVLLVVTYRPEFVPAWSPAAHVGVLPLGRLEARECEAMIDRLTPGEPLPVDVKQQIVARTDGIPLFIEELTRTILETAHDRQAVMRLVLPSIPTTLQDSLAARLDRLGPIKEVAQIGAVIGRSFSSALLKQLSPLLAGGVDAALKTLVEAGLVFHVTKGPGETYAFKHSLVQDAAYQSILKSRRRQLHGQIAQALETWFPDIAEREPEVLAHHLTLAEQNEPACGYWLVAGKRAAQRWAYVEATTDFTRGLELLEALPQGERRDRLELEFQVGLGRVLTLRRGYGAAETEPPFRRAYELASRLGESGQLFGILSGIFGAHLGRGDLSSAPEIARQLEQIAARQGNPNLTMWSQVLRAAAACNRGEFEAARDWIEGGLALYDPAKHARHVFIANHDAKGLGLLYGGYTLWALGYPDQALEAHEGAEQHARRLKHPYVLAHALTWGATAHQFRRDAPLLREKVEEGIAIARDKGFPYIVGTGQCELGWALVALGRREQGIAEAREGLRLLEETGLLLGYPYLLVLMAEVLGEAGQAEDALAHVDRAIEVTEASSQRLYEAETYRVQGRLHHVLGDRGAAERSLRLALDVARRQAAKGWELRAATELARLWSDHGRPVQARDLLAPAYAWFSEGFEVPDLKEARTLLDQLS